MRHWDRRLLTQEGDRELMTRHETQERCPEILITNYSMLELCYASHRATDFPFKPAIGYARIRQMNSFYFSR